MESPGITKLAFRTGIAFLLIAGGIGVMLRIYYLYPFHGFVPENWLHAHSHITFLGWIFLGIISLINTYLRENRGFPEQRFIPVIACIVASNLGMLISFPILGYGTVSIFFLALHMAAGIYAYFLYRPFFLRNASFAMKMMHSAFIFMILSGLGPMALGPLIALGYRDTFWYDFAVYFYLHFQYNGWFTLAIFGILCLELDLPDIHNSWLYLINVSIVLTYLLSTLAIRPPEWIYYLGGFGAFMQIIPFIYLLVLLLKNHRKILLPGRPLTNALLLLSLGAFETKMYLQFFSSIPAIADWALHRKNMIIAYLHFVLLGFVTSFLIGWWNRKLRIRDSRLFNAGSYAYLCGLAAIEFTLIFHVLGVFEGYHAPYSLLLIFSVVLAFGISMYLIDSMRDPIYPESTPDKE